MTTKYSASCIIPCNREKALIQTTCEVWKPALLMFNVLMQHSHMNLVYYNLQKNIL